MAGTEDFEVSEVIPYVPDERWVQNMFQDVSKMSVAKQTLVGGVTGWCAGMVFAKVGKVAAATVGTSLLLLQVAQHQGYVTVNWTKIEKNMSKARKQIESDTRKAYPNFVSNVSSFFEQNVFLASGFAGGFLLGISS